MRLLSSLFYALFVLMLAACQGPAAPPLDDRPNIILIMTDDQGYGDLGFHGNDAIRTPNLDALAAASTRFRQFYVSPVCAPTRSSLLTGRYTLRTGVFDTYNGGAIMAARETTLAEVLAAAGYRTAVFGKWHLGDSYPGRPGDQGFAESLVHLSGGVGQVGDYVNYHALDSSYFNPVLFHNGRPVKTSGYCSDVYTDAAIRFIEANAGEPFFLYLAYNAPHTPLQVPRSYYDRYAALDSIPGRSGLLAAGVREEQLPSLDVIRRLYGMITNIDDNVGRLLAQLEASGVREETLVIFLTDNGPQQFRYTAGLRARKGSVYEGGIRVPAFFYWPETLTGGREIDSYAAHIDVLPTLLGLAGIPLPDTLDLDGRDWSAALQGAEAPAGERPLVFQWQRGYPEPYRNIAVRRGPYKLVGPAGGGLELYNLDDDPGERYDLSAGQPAMVKELTAYFDEWLETALSSPSVGDTRIVLGSTYENPVVLNRNDARGSPGMWRQDQIYGYWDVQVLRGGLYDFRIHYFEPPWQAGDALVRIGPVQRTVFNADTTATEVLIGRVPLRPGEWMVESWYAGQDRGGEGPAFTHFPFYIEVERVE